VWVIQLSVIALRVERPERLALLQYPVRCRNCRRRTFVGLPLALVLYQTRRAKRKVSGEV